ncbi:radical SAM family heme chaperone HemW [Catenuloplanes atrovinosus]|uniref:Heme chaperone HemW n=1 Tax=Catenuloplanes atrovinosus TaxID=137266 RepID=A0AAE3YUH0_9ACTN|nr:radical SAM family heme chaperone HemW [Catenuloplanes atrovinosus]MDR7278613.1 oxygen-independent coproporphyrinogen-3 oxidase [Catenuloplanes atrovinosus]
MPGELPDGEAVPRDGALPPAALEASGRRGFGVYVHVPFCASRCGYCDFNTYTATELGGGASRDEYAETVLAELRLASHVMTKKPEKVDTVFVGGGTPTLLPADDLARILEAIDDTWGLAADAEVTTEANPESVDLSYLRRLRAAGFTRVSLGMQSTAPGVLRILERQHSAGRAPAAAIEAREAGFEHVNLDLIYGTPGETADDFDRSLAAVIDAGVDHVSAYALIVEDGTRLAARMRRGELPYPDDDVAADRYLAADRALTAAGLHWYEVSNWAATPEARCRHNLLYWTGGDWWGLGPGAHSHVGGVRWWNVKHPAAYAKRLAAGETPALARELLTDADRHLEDVMLRVRLAEGLPLAALDEAGRAGAKGALVRGLLEPDAYDAGRIVLTRDGRLLADGVIRDLLT